MSARETSPTKKRRSALAVLIDALRSIPPVRKAGKACLERLRRSSTFQKQVVKRLAPRGKDPGPGKAGRIAVEELESALRRVAGNKGTVVVGPWLSEVGFEVLYWIPFLNWAVRRFKIDPSRIVVVSRGGTAGWYRTVGGRYLDIFDHFSPDTFRDGNLRRVEEAGGQKHRGLSAFDEEVLRRVREVLGTAGAEIDLIHPSLMYNFLTPFWRGKAPFSHLKDHSEPLPFEPLPAEAPLPDLPRDYVAAKFYFSACFPDSPSNRSFISSLLRKAAGSTPVVLLSSGLAIDDHRDWIPDLEKRGSLISLEGRMTPERNLEVQTAAVARARLFIGTYGGFSYLAPLYGVPSVALYSEPRHFLPVHLEVAQEVFRREGFGSFSAMNARDLERLGMLGLDGRGP